MRFALRALTMVVLLGAAALPGAPVRAEEPFHERVDKAIERGVAWLKGRQFREGTYAGSWGWSGAGQTYEGGSDTYNFPQGPSAFALYTLLKCGVPADDPCIESGFKRLAQFKSNAGSNYETAALVLALEARHNPFKRERTRAARASDAAEVGKAPDLEIKLPRKDKRWMAGLVETLLRNQQDDGGWLYSIGSREMHENDMSNTQMVMLALHAAQRCGMKIPRKTIERAIEFALRHQEEDGAEVVRPTPGKRAGDTAARVVDRARGWAYAPTSSRQNETVPSGTMTSGGLVVLLVGRDVLRQIGPRSLQKREKLIETAFRDGLAWLDRNWDVRDNPPMRRHYQYMHLWGLERVGDLARLHLIGKHDWYAEGAGVLLEEQFDDGRWERNDTHAPQDVLNTCFALLFLDRATLTATTTR